MPLPIPRPISGRRLAPKIRMMIMRMMMSSGIPTRPSMVAPFGYDGYGKRPDLTISRRVGLRTLVALAGALAALTSGPSARGRQFTSAVNVVEVYAAVLDREG